MCKLDLDKAEEPEIKLPTPAESQKKETREFQKTIYFCFINYAKAFDPCGSQQTMENSSRDGNTRSPYLPLWEICIQVRKQQLELDMEQWTGSK